MKASFSGSCFNGCNSRLQIAPSRTFSLFLHAKTSAPTRVRLDINSLSVRDHLVHIGNQPRIKVIEHLFSALYGLGLFNVRIDFYGNEIPFFDGSSKDFVRSLQDFPKNGQAKIIKPRTAFSVRSGTAFIRYEPAQGKKLVIDMELAHPFIKRQKLCIVLDRKTYTREIAPARTFAFIGEKDPRLHNLPPYGFGITHKRVYSREPLRYPDEAVRHKILDLLGDLFVLRKRLAGRITARNTSHRLNIKFAKKLLGEFVE